MEKPYAKVIVLGSPITKSNFKLSNSKGRAILPNNSGLYHDRYALYEEEIAYNAKIQNPNTCLSEALIAVLKVYYKSEKRHPDTNNITKSIFDGIEKSGLIINDAQIRRLIIEEFYDKDNPRFELELFGESCFKMDYSIISLDFPSKKIEYSPPVNKKRTSLKSIKAKEAIATNKSTCEICNKNISNGAFITANNGKTIVCKKCLLKGR
ncbi:Endodeoxyribonuclease RusA [Clostridium cavendishii DSM 21758]|uniref:Endodeoxyribonuclease RusA n=1 Tax=Clostridium cavendishii DSM 21758 TaxID=1121302 RepID=A0A1M6U9G3_9CLOT|nr:RusA family crossover junction endodeoxyribonuclease [Clostridium cavendishii]SHK65806.1 Endodeoxyribonuclease RusA [Clostridium cavendishii DSM 21758]